MDGISAGQRWLAGESLQRWQDVCHATAVFVEFLEVLYNDGKDLLMPHPDRYVIAQEDPLHPGNPLLTEDQPSWATALECLQRRHRYDRPGQKFYGWKIIDGRFINLNQTSELIAKHETTTEYRIYLRNGRGAHPPLVVAYDIDLDQLTARRAEIAGTLEVLDSRMTLDRTTPVT